MDNSDKETIRCNLPTLIHNTNCSADLFSWLPNVLSNYDIQCIKSNRTKLDKASQLYEIIQTKTDGYDKLVQALIKTKQFKSAEILLNAAILSAISKSAVNITGKNYAVKELFAENELKQLAKSVSKKVAMEDLYNCYKDFLLVSNNIELKDTIPPAPSYYIRRHIYAKRKKLDTAVFKVACPDVFVFRSNQVRQLTSILSNQPLYHSAKQLVKVTGKFILLNQDIDWPEIRRKSKSPTHLVEHGFCGAHTCLLLDTTAGSEIIHNFLRHDSDEASTVEENQFIRTFSQTSDSGICICDKPGMGKSLLLANFARNVQKLCQKRIVIFIQLSKFSEKLSTSSITLDALSSLNFVLDYLNDNVICQTIIKSLPMIQEPKMEIFFDGFDEIQQHNMVKAKSLLSQLNSLHNIRLYVTSRIYTRKDLEESLGVLSYDIQPFSDKNQVDFLTNFWCKQYPENDSKRIVKYSKFCLQELRIKLNDREREMTGVPLLCMLVANIYGDSARIYSQPERNSSADMCSPGSTSLAEVYMQYIKSQLDRSACNLNCLVDAESASCNGKCKRKSFHTWVAIQTVCPDLFRKMRIKLIPATTTDRSIFSSGLLVERCGTSYVPGELEFVHRTFAEFLVAELFFVVLVKEPKNIAFKAIRDIMRDFLGSLLASSKQCNEFVENYELQRLFLKLGEKGLLIDKPFQNEVFVYFFEWFLCNVKPPLRLGDSTEFSWSGHDALFVLLGCIQLNYKGIFQLIAKMVFSPSGGSLRLTRALIIRRCRSFFISHYHKNALIYSLMAVKYSDMPLVIQLLEYFQQSYLLDFPNLIADLPNSCGSHLEVAIRASKPEMVSYFSKYFPLKGWDLLNCCLNGNRTEGIWFDESRLDCCKFFVDGVVNGNIERHVDIIKGLILLGANITKLVGGVIPLYYFVCWLLSPVEYLELQQYFLRTDKTDISIRDYAHLVETFIFYPKSKYSMAKVEGIISLYNKPVSVKSFVTDVFHKGIFWGRSVKELKVLVEWGAMYSTNSVLDRGKTALHVAAKRETNEIVDYLISLRVPLSFQDNDGNTPLHVATLNKRMATMKLLIRNGCKTYLRNSQGRTFLQMAAKWTDSYGFDAENKFIELLAFVKDFAAEPSFSEKARILEEASKTRYGANLPEIVNELLGLIV